MAVFRFVYLSAAALAGAAGALVAASLFIPGRAPQSHEFIAVTAVVSAAFFGIGLVLFGIQRHLARIVDAATRPGETTGPGLAKHIQHLLAYLLAGGVFSCLVLGSMVYAILARIDQGFAVFG